MEVNLRVFSSFEQLISQLTYKVSQVGILGGVAGAKEGMKEHKGEDDAHYPYSTPLSTPPLLLL
jgi:hypothetical protein